MAQILSPRIVRLRGMRQPIWPQIDETHPINRGLVGYWQLDGQGVLVPDYSGFGNNGTASNVGLKDSHHGGNAFSFNGSSSIVTIAANAAILGGTPRSFVAWVNTSNVTTIEGFFSYGVATTNNTFIIYNNVTNGGDVYVAGNGNDVRTNVGGFIAANTWAQIAITYNGGALSVAGNLKIYVNGVSQNTTLAAGSSGAVLNTSSSAIQIGNGLGSNFYSGAIEGVRWYNRELNAAEVTQLFAEPYAGIVDVPPSFLDSGIIPVGLPLMGQIWLA